MTTQMDSSTADLIKQWLAQDRNPTTRHAVSTSAPDPSWFHPRISFGTAGLRATVGAGFARINDLVILQTSRGLARWILHASPAAAASTSTPHTTTTIAGIHTVVIGYDGRADSRRFAELTASAMLHAGIQVLWLGKLVHTPLVAFTVKCRQASAGVMITASHNPKEDNGYKVYAGNGCQINTPVDEQIQQAIMQDLDVPEEVWDTQRVDSLVAIGEEMQMLYVTELQEKIGSIPRPPRFVYTPLHGTGLEIFTKSLQALTGVVAEKELDKFFLPVPEQSQPDPEFPTVKYPNPEEDGALSLAQRLAEENDIKLIIANDPDADRLAVSERTADGKWYQLKGDEVGALLGWYIFTKYQSTISTSNSSRPKMFTSAVSSSFLQTIGSAVGFTVEETLTGFKWIGNVALSATQTKGETVLFGYEEALGYMLPSICHDKDGISAAMLFLQATTQWQESEKAQSPLQVLRSLYRDYGWVETANTYFKSPSVAVTSEVFERVQANPRLIADNLPPDTKIRVRDAAAGTDDWETDGKSRLPVVPGNLMITLWLSMGTNIPTVERGGGSSDTTRITIRASGTEPKVKIYVESKSTSSREVAADGAVRALKAVARTWFTDERFVVEERWRDVLR